MAGLRFICGLIGLLCVLASPARAQTLEDTTCMPEVMTAIEARAWLEAEREIIQNQNLIAKPDSILEYSCFEQHLTLSGEFTGRMFTEREWYFLVSDAYIDEYTLDRGLYYTVFEALVSYLAANYWHQYLGDRAPLPSLATVPGFSCYAMGYVWNRAKCSNFIEPRNAQDGFYTFAEYSAMTDPRNLPAPDVCPAPTQWSSQINDSQVMSAPITSAAATTGLNDDLVVYPALFDPADCAATAPIPTGIFVPPLGGEPGYEEHICVAPGCYYDRTAGACAR